MLAITCIFFIWHDVRNDVWYLLPYHDISPSI